MRICAALPLSHAGSSDISNLLVAFQVEVALNDVQHHVELTEQHHTMTIRLELSQHKIQHSQLA